MATQCVARLVFLQTVLSEAVLPQIDACYRSPYSGALDVYENRPSSPRLTAQIAVTCQSSRVMAISYVFRDTAVALVLFSPQLAA